MVGATAENAKRCGVHKEHEASEVFARKLRRVIIGIVDQFSWPDPTWFKCGL
jgi:hypothetical protein